MIDIRWWDWPAALLLLAAIYVAATRLNATGWTDELNLVQTVALLGVPGVKTIRSYSMFGFSTVLRSGTQGKAQFTMEFALYKQVPQSIAEELVKKATEEKKSVA